MSVTSILSKLNQINESNLISVYVPSAKKEMKFKPISVRQQKDLIKSGLDGILSGIIISNVINQVITDNSVEKYDFLVVDKIPVILSLRKQSFGSEFVSKQDQNETRYDLDLILSKDLAYTNIGKTKLSLDNVDITVTLDVLTLEEDTKINNFQLDKLKKGKEEDISETVGSLFIYEILKFITKLEVNKEEVDMKAYSIKDRLSVVENIPAELNNKILEYIQGFRKEEMDYITVDGNTLSIDARLFSKE
jgi:hypothetical protein